MHSHVFSIEIWQCTSVISKLSSNHPDLPMTFICWFCIEVFNFVSQKRKLFLKWLRNHTNLLTENQIWSVFIDIVEQISFNDAVLHYFFQIDNLSKLRVWAKSGWSLYILATWKRKNNLLAVFFIRCTRLKFDKIWGLISKIK